MLEPSYPCSVVCLVQNGVPDLDIIMSVKNTALWMPLKDVVNSLRINPISRLDIKELKFKKPFKNG